MSADCRDGEHIECDGTVEAPGLMGWWDACPCDCHKASK
jgi:hypothetical protein